MMIYASSVVGASSCTIRFMLYTHMHSTPHTLTVVITCANLSLSLSSPPPSPYCLSFFLCISRGFMVCQWPS